MGITWSILALLAGFALIIKGGDWFVDASVWVARKTGIPEIIIGATIVSVGTTIPEISVSVISVIKGLATPELATSFNEIAINNSVGSMLCNTALILAIVMTISPPRSEGRSFTEKAVALITIIIILIFFVMTGSIISLVEGIILLALFFAFMFMNFNDAKSHINDESNQELILANKEEADKSSTPKNIIMFILGAGAIGIGAWLLSTFGQKLAQEMGVPAQIIGITVIAFGTSLPELVTSITALKKGNRDMGIGNIIGANVINATLLLGLISVILGDGLPVDSITKNVSLWVLLAITLVLCIPAIFKDETKKWQGWTMLAIYFGFITYNFVIVL